MRTADRLQKLLRGPPSPTAEATEVARLGQPPLYALLDSGGDSACCGGSGWRWMSCRCAWPAGEQVPPPYREHWHLDECWSAGCQAVNRPWRRKRALRSAPHGMVPILPGHPHYEARKAATR